MGQFSWLDCITKEQIIDDKRRDVFLLVPQAFGGGHIVEHCYDGYGTFGGEDAYALLARWNRPEMCIGDDDRDRDVGIDLAFDEDAVIQYPLKMTHNASAVYEECEASEDDPNQGWEVDPILCYTYEVTAPNTTDIIEVNASCEESAAFALWDEISGRYNGLTDDEWDSIETILLSVEEV